MRVDLRVDPGVTDVREVVVDVRLVDAFAVAREHGAAVSGLSTDSRTGALGLYEKVGMVTTDVWVNRAKDL